MVLARPYGRQSGHANHGSFRTDRVSCPLPIFCRTACVAQMKRSACDTLPLIYQRMIHIPQVTLLPPLPSGIRSSRGVQYTRHEKGDTPHWRQAHRTGAMKSLRNKGGMSRTPAGFRASRFLEDQYPRLPKAEPWMIGLRSRRVLRLIREDASKITGSPRTPKADGEGRV